MKTGMPRCPRRCDESFTEQAPSYNTDSSLAYLCCACGTIFYINKRVIPRSEERQMWNDKYGTKEDI